MSSHLLFQATNGMDIGAVSMMLYGWREREEVLRLLRDDHRPADEPQLHPARRRRRRPARRLAGASARTSATSSKRASTTTTSCSPRTRSGASARSASASSRTEECLARSITGPILRSTGFAWDLRKAQPLPRRTTRSTSTSSTRSNGDVFDRYRIRLYEILESVKIVRQCVEKMPAGDYRVAGQEDHAAAARPHRRVDGSADPPLQAVHRGLQGAAGRDVRRDRVAARRDRLLPGERRLGEAGAHAHPRAVLLQPAGDRTDGRRAASSPTRSRSSRASTRSWARSTGERE